MPCFPVSTIRRSLNAGALALLLAGCGAQVQRIDYSDGSHCNFTQLDQVVEEECMVYEGGKPRWFPPQIVAAPSPFGQLGGVVSGAGGWMSFVTVP